MELGRYNKIKFNDIANVNGVSVSVFLQGCDFHCNGCFNKETWDWGGGIPFTSETLVKIEKGLTAHGIKRNLCILGGEPLHSRNFETTKFIVSSVKRDIPDTKIFIWTGFKFNDLTEEIKAFLKEKVDVLVDGQFEKENYKYGLKMRGSTNQKIIDLKNKI